MSINKRLLDAVFSYVIEKTAADKEMNYLSYQAAVVKTRALIDAFIAKHPAAIIILQNTSPIAGFQLWLNTSNHSSLHKTVYKIEISETYENLDIYVQEKNNSFTKID